MSLVTRVVMEATRVIRRDDDDDGNSDCVTATPGPRGYVSDMSACNAYYNYDPQPAAAIAVAVLFGLFMGAHIVEGFVYKKRYTWVLIMGATWETIAFILHSLGSYDQQQIGYATGWNILFLLAPLWINAFVYMTFSREAYWFLPEEHRKIRGFNATSVAKLFVWADILTFIIQAAGGVMASPGASPDIITTGLHIYLAGMGLQQFFICCFLWLMVEFHLRCSAMGIVENGEGTTRRGWKPLHVALYAVLTCITVRIIYRICEFAGGITTSNPVPFHEAYAYALDCFPMLLALLILAIWHPGRYIVGSDAEFKAAKKQRKLDLKAAKKQRKEEKKAGKLGYESTGHIVEEYDNHSYDSRGSFAI
ncbi:RTA1 like protein-domain-containing protein [Xylariales sp. PMI_506]|nr:RTA1 like protein-domain-containing protein [Xylariales sp. PMI_506]